MGETEDEVARVAARWSDTALKWGALIGTTFSTALLAVLAFMAHSIFALNSTSSDVVRGMFDIQREIADIRSDFGARLTKFEDWHRDADVAMERLKVEFQGHVVEQEREAGRSPPRNPAPN